MSASRSDASKTADRPVGQMSLREKRVATPPKRQSTFHSRGRERGQGDGRATTEPELLCPQKLFVKLTTCETRFLWSPRHVRKYFPPCPQVDPHVPLPAWPMACVFSNAQVNIRRYICTNETHILLNEPPRQDSVRTCYRMLPLDATPHGPTDVLIPATIVFPSPPTSAYAYLLLYIPPELTTCLGRRNRSLLLASKT